MKLKMILSVIALAMCASAYSQDAEPAVYEGMGACEPVSVAPCEPAQVVEPCAPTQTVETCAPVEACAPVATCSAVADCDTVKVAVGSRCCCLSKLFNQAKARVASYRVPKVRTSVVERVVVKRQIVRAKTAKVAEVLPCAPVCESCK